MGVLSSPQEAANSSNFFRCSPFSLVGTSTRTRTRKSPLVLLSMLVIPYPRSRTWERLWFPGGFLGIPCPATLEPSVLLPAPLRRKRWVLRKTGRLHPGKRSRARGYELRHTNPRIGHRGRRLRHFASIAP